MGRDANLGDAFGRLFDNVAGAIATYDQWGPKPEYDPVKVQTELNGFSDFLSRAPMEITNDPNVSPLGRRATLQKSMEKLLADSRIRLNENEANQYALAVTKAYGAWSSGQGGLAFDEAARGDEQARQLGPAGPLAMAGIQSGDFSGLKNYVMSLDRLEVIPGKTWSDDTSAGDATAQPDVAIPDRSGSRGIWTDAERKTAIESLKKQASAAIVKSAYDSGDLVGGLNYLESETFIPVKEKEEWKNILSKGIDNQTKQNNGLFLVQKEAIKTDFESAIKAYERAPSQERYDVFIGKRTKSGTAGNNGMSIGLSESRSGGILAEADNLMSQATEKWKKGLLSSDSLGQIIKDVGSMRTRLDEANAAVKEDSDIKVAAQLVKEVAFAKIRFDLNPANAGKGFDGTAFPGVKLFADDRTVDTKVSSKFVSEILSLSDSASKLDQESVARQHAVLLDNAKYQLSADIDGGMPFGIVREKIRTDPNYEGLPTEVKMDLLTWQGSVHELMDSNQLAPANAVLEKKYKDNPAKLSAAKASLAWEVGGAKLAKGAANPYKKDGQFIPDKLTEAAEIYIKNDKDGALGSILTNQSTATAASSLEVASYLESVANGRFEMVFNPSDTGKFQPFALWLLNDLKAKYPKYIGADTTPVYVKGGKYAGQIYFQANNGDYWKPTSSGAKGMSAQEIIASSQSTHAGTGASNLDWGKLAGDVKIKWERVPAPGAKPLPTAANPSGVSKARPMIGDTNE